jgi:hypothetical protein
MGKSQEDDPLVSRGIDSIQAIFAFALFDAAPSAQGRLWLFPTQAVVSSGGSEL